MFASQAEAEQRSERLVDSKQNLHSKTWGTLFDDEQHQHHLGDRSKACEEKGVFTVQRGTLHFHRISPGQQFF